MAKKKGQQIEKEEEWEREKKYQRQTESFVIESSSMNAKYSWVKAKARCQIQFSVSRNTQPNELRAASCELQL